jgi:acyl-CoA thioesterase-1
MAFRVSVFGILSAGLVAFAWSHAASAQESNTAPAPGATPPAVPSQPVMTQPMPRRPLVRAGDQKFSSECKVKSPAYEGRASLRAVRRAILEKRPVRVVAVGSSSPTGFGSSAPTASYPVRLENGLEGVIEGLKVEMFTLGQAGDVEEAAAERFKAEVAEIRPDLVVWQVGTNDAVARIDAATFGEQLRDSLSWLASHKIDVVLIDPQYIERLSNDTLYTGIVNEVATIASEKRVLLVNRYDAMADMARQNPGSSASLANDRFHLNDLGYRCMAEYATKAIVSGILQAENENGAMH